MLTVDWWPLSLTVLNAGREIPGQYRASMEVGHATLRIVAALRAASREAEVGDLYTEVGRRLFHDQETPSPAPVAAATERVGLGGMAAAATDEAHDEAIVASTDEAIRRGGPDVGSPILVVGDGTRGFHGPVVSPPVGEDALRLWDAVSTLTQIPGVYEVKHGREGGVEYGPRP